MNDYVEAAMRQEAEIDRLFYDDWSTLRLAGSNFIIYASDSRNGRRRHRLTRYRMLLMCEAYLDRILAHGHN